MQSKRNKRINRCLPVTKGVFVAALLSSGYSQAAVTLSPAVLDFGVLDVGASAIQTVTVQHDINPQGDPTDVNSIGVSGTGFSLTGGGTCAAALFTFNAGSESCTVEVQFMASSEGAQSGGLNVSWDANTHSPAGSLNISLSAEGAAEPPLPPTPRTPTSEEQIPTMSAYGLSFTVLGLLGLAARRLTKAGRRR